MKTTVGVKVKNTFLERMLGSVAVPTRDGLYLPTSKEVETDEEPMILEEDP